MHSLLHQKREENKIKLTFTNRSIRFRVFPVVVCRNSSVEVRLRCVVFLLFSC